MIVKLLTENHLEFLSLKGGCRGLTESTSVKMLHCWKSHALAQLTHYLIEMPINAFANREDPDQGLLCLLMEI